MKIYKTTFSNIKNVLLSGKRTFKFMYEKQPTFTEKNFNAILLINYANFLWNIYYILHKKE